MTPIYIYLFLSRETLQSAQMNLFLEGIETRNLATHFLPFKEMDEVSKLSYIMLIE